MVMAPASPRRCQGSPSTSASSCSRDRPSAPQGGVGPKESALMQPARTQPDLDAVVHQHLHAVGASIGKEVSMVRLGRPEDLDNARQRDVGARAHVQRLGRQPPRIDTDHRCSSRIHAAHSDAAATGQETLTVSAPLRSSMTNSCSGVGCEAVSGSAMTECAGVGLSVPWRADGTSAILRHLYTRFAFRPWASACRPMKLRACRIRPAPGA